MPLPANNPGPSAEPSLIAGSVLPIQRAEELLATLPGVISARIVASSERRGRRDSHPHDDRCHAEADRSECRERVDRASRHAREPQEDLGGDVGRRTAHRLEAATPRSRCRRRGSQPAVGPRRLSSWPPTPTATVPVKHRRLYFEDVEVRRSRTQGNCLPRDAAQGRSDVHRGSRRARERAPAHRAGRPCGAGGDPSGRG